MTKARIVICERCDERFETKSHRALFCPECRDYKQLEYSRKWQRANREYINARDRARRHLYKDKGVQKKCIKCKIIKKHCARGMCWSCYMKWWYLNNKHKQKRIKKEKEIKKEPLFPEGTYRNY